MTLQDWRDMITEAIQRHHDGDNELLELLAYVLYEQDAAKQLLRESGYGNKDMGLLDTVEAVVERS